MVAHQPVGAYKAFAGRPWAVAEASEAAHFVGGFPSFDEAQKAFCAIRFTELPNRSGHRRWRGCAPSDGMIVQLEADLDESQDDQLQYAWLS